MLPCVCGWRAPSNTNRAREEGEERGTREEGSIKKQSKAKQTKGKDREKLQIYIYRSGGRGTRGEEQRNRVRRTEEQGEKNKGTEEQWEKKR